MDMKKVILTGLFYLMSFPLFAQQETQYGQYIYNGLYVNPAYAGYKEAMFAQAIYRAQWTGLKGAPQSLSIAFDAPIPDKDIAVGAIVTKDKIGAQSTLNAYANLAYRLRLNHNVFNVLAFGIGVGVMQTGLNGSLLTAEEVGDAKIPVGFESRTMPSLRVGAQLTTETFFIGFSANNLFAKRLTTDNDFFANLNTQEHLYFTAAMMFPVQRDINFKPSFLIKDDLHGPTSLDINSFLIFKDKFSIGAVYRTSLNLFPRPAIQNNLLKKSAIGVMTDFLVKERLRIGYGFDYSLNKLGNYGFGSHEISVGYYFNLAPVRNKLFFCF
jgi:type IX secretion system PorP/SprF family membrane protein